MLSEIVGLSKRPIWDQKKSVLDLVLQVWCVVKHGLVTLVIIMILKDTDAFQVLFIVSLFCSWTSLLSKSTVAFTYLIVKSTKCLCLHPVVLAWSCYFVLGLKNLVLFRSLTVYYAALLPRRGRIMRRTLSVCLSVRLSVRPVIVFVYFFYSRTVLRANIQNRKTSVFAYGPASRMYFSARTEGRISYGHLGRTNLSTVDSIVTKS